MSQTVTQIAFKICTNYDEALNNNKQKLHLPIVFSIRTALVQCKQTDGVLLSFVRPNKMTFLCD